MKKICVATATRAEYGLLKNTIRQIQEDGGLELCLLVTGTHLVKELGYTVSEIEEDGFPIAERIDMGLTSDDPSQIVQSMGRTMMLFGDAFTKEKPDMLVVLGDRYELLPICSAALVMGIPIAHISGGEVTEGAIDDCVRHSITKLSNLHFPGCEEYRQRIIQLGEQPDCVFNYGDVGIENIKKTPIIPKDELEKDLGVSLEKAISMTFHPLTTKPEEVEAQIGEVLEAVSRFPEYTFVITKANADAGGRKINQLLEAYVKEHGNCHLFASLGIRRYINVLRNVKAVIGNSSSGIVEAPVLRVPTVNIGDRQKGRLMADSIISCEVESDEIENAIKWALSKEGQDIASQTKSPYEAGETSKSIVTEIKKYLNSEACKQPKCFYDLPRGGTKCEI
ncbi:MAG: UDP-N-acetylglucosamine 2-epimerase (hydrolyzing) [Lachnospiraceae bacterium]|jgi:UDP-hydrolysing UDP-N-acetyl-D-glucosamine 2-epimerase|nr:UDP-N-acetylglucosamine 2-epimerase (hydrolyzing) [Lachnospiraceae bacterium]